MDTEFQIKDTGISKRTGTEIYTKYKDGAWLLYKAFSIRYEGNVSVTDHVAPREDTPSTLTHVSNEITAVHPPRYTIQGTIVNADAANMKDLEELRRHKGVKRITGGLNTLSALKDGTDTYDYVEVIITNLTYTENYQNDTTNVNFTLQLKKV